MTAIMNDLPFQEQFGNKTEAIEKIQQWLMICKKLESSQASEVDELCGGKIDMTTMIAPDCCLAQLVKDISNRDEMRYLIHLLQHLRNPVIPTTEPFQFSGKQSYICGCAQDGFVVSLEMNAMYASSVLKGVQGTACIALKNIATESHILENEEFLGIRHYEANPKHRREAYRDAAGRYVDAMDLDEIEAQELLNCAVNVDDNLYGKKYGQYYCFQRHHANCYHGYQNNNLPLHIKNQIDKYMDC